MVVFSKTAFATAMFAITLLVPASVIAQSLLQKDPAANLKHLQETGKIAINFVRRDTVFKVDASAVLPVSAKSFFRSITAYSQFAKYKLPGINTSHVLSAHNNSTVIWYHVKTTGINSRHCNIVKAIDQSKSDNGYYATTWNLQACPRSKTIKQKLPDLYADKPSFEELSGSFYVLPLPNNKQGKPRIYIRYTLHSKVKSIIPKSVLYWISKFKVKSDTIKAIRIYEAQAKKLQR